MSVSMKSLVLALWLTTISACGSGGSGFTGPVSGIGVEPVDGVVTEFLAEEEVPGAAAAVVVDGRLVHARGYGFADLARTEPVRPEHLFRVASVSKPITGIAVLKAVDDGLLELDGSLGDLLADLMPDAGPTDPRVPGITVEHLLHHGSGWTQWGYPDDPLFRMKEIAAEFGVPSPPPGEVLVRWVLGQELGFAPGTGFRYTNIGYVTLARVIEAAAGMPYEAFVRARVLAPAGVTRARIGGIRRADRLEGEVEYESEPSEAWRSIFDGESGPAAEPAYGGINLSGMDGSSGWVLSVVDLARLGAAVDGRPSAAEILPVELRAYMVADGAPGEWGYGAGFFVTAGSTAASQGFERLSYVDHSGGMPGTNAYLHVREDGLIVA
ncbi:MAG TPA: serine hydrolase domain-containing protein, partial [Longimicrobiales bacterium]|nr:serine hydrolase domain-containing protein [Longimicrobiales bacterium]